MPKIGLSQCFAAKRNYDPVSGVLLPYTEGTIFGRAVSYGNEVTSTDNNNFYADNIVAESQSGEFASGTITVETAELTPKAGILILGLIESTLLVDGVEVTEYLDSGDATPELGYGTIEKWKVQGNIRYRGVVYPRVAFNVPSDEVTTQGEEIEWQTDTIEGTVMREQQSTNGKQLWRRKSSLFETEAEAAAYIRAILNISDGNSFLSTLSLGSITLNPTFSPSTMAYTATTANATNTITATAADPGSTIVITNNGTTVENGSAITWEEGTNNVSVAVTNAGSVTTYTIAVTKE